MSFLTGLSLTALVAAAAAFFQQIRTFFRYLSGFVLLHVKIMDGLSTHIPHYIRFNYKQLPSGNIVFRNTNYRIDSSSEYTAVPFEMPSAPSIWWGREGVYILSMTSSGVSLTGLRWFCKPRQLVSSAVAFWERTVREHYSNGEGNFYVVTVKGTAGESFSFRSGSSDNNDVAVRPPTSAGSPADSLSSNSNFEICCLDESFMYEKSRYVENKKNIDPFKGLFFNDEVKELVKRARRWLTERNWYEERSIPWRMGVMLYGPGGTGKSSLARATSQTLGIPLYQFFMNTLTDNEFLREWGNLQTPCSVVLEDFDTVFHGREPVTVHKSLSFETVLNSISGVSSKNGILLFVTTNKLEHIDPALGQIDENGRPTRPGRIDIIMRLAECSEQQRKEIANHVLGGWAEDLMFEALSIKDPMTASQFQNLCVQRALERKGEELNLNGKEIIDVGTTIH